MEEAKRSKRYSCVLCIGAVGKETEAVLVCTVFWCSRYRDRSGTRVYCVLVEEVKRPKRYSCVLCIGAGGKETEAVLVCTVYWCRR